jgi:hypothetical protein
MGTNEKRVEQGGSIQYVRLGQMSVPEWAQRKFNQSKADKILAEFELDDLGLPVLAERRGVYYILDGQHRIAAVKAFLGDGWEDQRLECRVYTGLSEAEMADKFDRLNDTLTVNTFDKFRIRVNAGRDIECSIKRIVEHEELRISKNQDPGAVSAVNTLRRIYTRSNEETLAKTLRIVRDSFGDTGMVAAVIDGIGHLCQRYNGALDEKLAIEHLGSTRGGVNGLLNKAVTLHKQTGGSKAHCVAAAAVDIINAGPGKGHKKPLPSWWAADMEKP